VVWGVHSTLVFLVFLLLVYVAESHYNFSVFFTFLGRIAMQGIKCDLLLLVQCGLCVCLLDTTVSHAKTNKR